MILSPVAAPLRRDRSERQPSHPRRADARAV